MLDYKFGHLEPVFATIQPPAVTVDPAPFAFLAPPSLDASQVKGQLVIEGGDQFETSGDTVVYENESGPANPGQLVQRVIPRMINIGADKNGNSIYGPDTLNGAPVTDTYISLEGAGLGIASTGQTSQENSPYYGIEMVGIEHLQLRLSNGNDNVTLNDNACFGTCTFSGAHGVPFTPALLSAPTLQVYGGGGNDSFTVNSLGAASLIAGGPGDDSVTVQSPASDLTTILSRLTVDGNNDLVTQVTNVLDNDSQRSCSSS